MSNPAYHAAYRAAHREQCAAYSRAWRAANPDKAAAHAAEHQAKYRATHREKIAAASAAYNATHRDERSAYRAAHREKMAAYSIAYHKAHPERAQEAARRWDMAHPEAVREKRRRHDARRRGAQSCNHPACLVMGAASLAWQTNEHVCYICGTPVWEGVNLHMDHVYPIAKGGIHCADNLRPACGPCNLRKHDLVLS